MSVMTGRSRESHIAMSPTAPEWLKPDKCRKLSLSGARVPKAWSSGILLREVTMVEQKAKHDKKSMTKRKLSAQLPLHIIQPRALYGERGAETPHAYAGSGPTAEAPIHSW